MTLYDVTVPISARLPVWPGDPAVKVERTANMVDGSPVNVSHLQLSTHSGTHVDPPFHFLPQGETMDAIPLERLIGPAWVADCRGVDEVSAELLERVAVPAGVTRLLLLTDNSSHWENHYHDFVPAFVDIAPSGAEWMVRRGMGLVGIDYMSADGVEDDDSPAHHILLGNGTLIIENLDLRHVPPNREYELLCLPLKIEGGDGAPARVVLRALANE